jgi:hypothetical protein
MTVAVLFADPKGVYSTLPDLDLWDLERDARNYSGTHPVVAHPPCQLWGNFARINFKRWGGEHNRPGNDGGCFVSALASVRQYGGVLEHPAGSRAFADHGIPKPVGTGWQRSGFDWICEVWQSAYGHRCQKRTWLLYVGSQPPAQLNWSRPEGTCQIGGFDRRKPVLRGRAASATPLLFAEALLALARGARLGHALRP